MLASHDTVYQTRCAHGFFILFIFIYLFIADTHCLSQEHTHTKKTTTPTTNPFVILLSSHLKDTDS